MFSWIASWVTNENDSTSESSFLYMGAGSSTTTKLSEDWTWIEVIEDGNHDTQIYVQTSEEGPKSSKLKEEKSLQRRRRKEKMAELLFLRSMNVDEPLLGFSTKTISIKRTNNRALALTSKKNNNLTLLNINGPEIRRTLEESTGVRNRKPFSFEDPLLRKIIERLMNTDKTNDKHENDLQSENTISYKYQLSIEWKENILSITWKEPQLSLTWREEPLAIKWYDNDTPLVPSAQVIHHISDNLTSDTFTVSDTCMLDNLASDISMSHSSTTDIPEPGSSMFGNYTPSRYSFKLASSSRRKLRLKRFSSTRKPYNIKWRRDSLPQECEDLRRALLLKEVITKHRIPRWMKKICVFSREAVEQEVPSWLQKIDVSLFKGNAKDGFDHETNILRRIDIAPDQYNKLPRWMSHLNLSQESPRKNDNRFHSVPSWMQAIKLPMKSDVNFNHQLKEVSTGQSSSTCCQANTSLYNSSCTQIIKPTVRNLKSLCKSVLNIAVMVATYDACALPSNKKLSEKRPIIARKRKSFSAISRKAVKRRIRLDLRTSKPTLKRSNKLQRHPKPMPRCKCG